MGGGDIGDDDGGDGLASARSKYPLPWAAGARLRVEVEAHAPGAMSAAAAGGFRPAIPAVVLSVDEPMGIVTRVSGDHLLVVRRRAF